MRSLRHLVAVLLLLPLAGPAARAAQEEPPGAAAPAEPAASLETPEPAKKAAARPGAYFNRYQVRYLDAYAAQTLAWDQCPRRETCDIKGLTMGRGSVLDITADGATHARIARALGERDVPRTQGFQLVLLAANGKLSGEAPSLSKGAQKALDDIKAFLPFKSYRVLDTALLRITQDDVAKAQVSGLTPVPYQLGLRFRSTGTGEKLFVDHFLLEEQKTDEDLIQTSFSMNVGETVVVGTSSTTGGQEALVALLTAMP